MSKPLLWIGLVVVASALTVTLFLLKPSAFWQKGTPAASESTAVAFTPTEKILETVSIPDKENISTLVVDFFKVGSFISGKYKGGDLILASIVDDGPCKGPSCGRPVRYRYARKGSEVTFLPRISEPHLPYGPEDPLQRTFNPFHALGLALRIDDESTVPVLEYPKAIVGDAPRQELAYVEEEEGVPDARELSVAFTHPVFGDVFTTRHELAPAKSFYADDASYDPERTVGGCRGEGCFRTNAFFAFRPDGTFLVYEEKPDFSTTDILWQRGTGGAEYDASTHAGCSEEQLDYASVVPPSLVRARDLKRAGTVRTTGDPVYVLRDPHHKLYREFYENYRRHAARWYEEGGTQYQEERGKAVASYDAFLAARPIFLWRDPFARLIRFSNKAFLPPLLCEPVLYLYPEGTQEVGVRVAPEGGISDSSPTHGDGWSVTADPSGRIVDGATGRVFPYLFWEGPTWIFPMEEEGFVVERARIEGFLQETLAQLGLNEREAADFIEAWAPKLSGAPYAFITFVPQGVIDRIAPLAIDPAPDTIIRVLMDFRPLEEPIDAPPLAIGPPPDRRGFTVVEWGVVVR